MIAKPQATPCPHRWLYSCAAALSVLLFTSHAAVLAQSASARLYVQRIEFEGLATVDDRVLRQRLLQVEGSFLNTSDLEESRLRLERLPYVARAKTRLEPVPGAADQVTVIITVTEAPARRYRLGGGYSASQRGSLNALFVHENVFGLGHRFAFNGRTSEFRSSANFAYTQPFVTPEGVSRTASLTFVDGEQLTADTSTLQMDLLALGFHYDIPLAPRQTLRAGLELHTTELATGADGSQQLRDWLASNGDSRSAPGLVGTDFGGADVLIGWRADSRDKDRRRGAEQRLTLRAALPGSKVEYFTLRYALTRYWPLPGRWTTKFGLDLAYGAHYGGSTTALPPHRHWFAGGPQTVRGYRENRLGPKDSLGNPYGGNLRTAAQLELLAPLPESWSRHLELALFYDLGNVFATEDVVFEDADGNTLDYGFDLSELRHSVGLATRIKLPIGTLGLSYGIPIGADDDNPNPFLRDELRRFQVTVGVEF